MFQRLKQAKQALENSIAEEQARQKLLAPSPAGSSSPARRSSSRTDSPASRPRKPNPKDSDEPAARGPDPSEFETAFVIEDESEDQPGLQAPAKMADDAGNNTPLEAGAKGEGQDGAAVAAVTSPPAVELPQDVRTKLRKLEKLEAKYSELLRSYRIAHGRAVSIEPFERALKENTPLESIAEPKALVDYLNQLNGQRGMITDELKRVSTEGQEFKKKFEEAEKQASALREQLESAKIMPLGEGSVAGTEVADTMSIDTPSASVKSPVSSVLGIFSPKQKAHATPDNKDVADEFFSYDDEVPKAQLEVKEKTAEIHALNSKVRNLETELAVTQESTSGLVASLEQATRELSKFQEGTAAVEALVEKAEAQTQEIQGLKDKLQAAENEVVEKEAKWKIQVSVLQTSLNNQESALKEMEVRHETETKEMAGKLETSETLKTQLYSKLEATNRELLEARKRADAIAEELKSEISKGNQQIMVLQKQLKDSEGAEHKEPNTATAPALEAPATSGAAKKKNKKKKGGAAAAAASTTSTAKENSEKDADSLSPAQPRTSTELEAEISKLQEEMSTNNAQLANSASVISGLMAEASELRQYINEKDAEIGKLNAKRKSEDDLREELVNVQESLISLGHELVDAKNEIKKLEAEKLSLKEEVEKLNKKSEGSETFAAQVKTLTATNDDLNSKTITLQTDLGASQQLAKSRYEELAKYKDGYQKVQSELVPLRTENATLKAANQDLTSLQSKCRRLEAREKDLMADVANLKKQAADKEVELRTSKEKITQETNGKLRAEDQTRTAQRDMRKSEAEKIRLASNLEKRQTELAEIQDEASKMRTIKQNLEEQISKLTAEKKMLQDEVELRASQYNTAQGLVSSIQEQERELAMQLKEEKAQKESREEELSDTEKLLNERTREAETMRRLLADKDDRADAKVREMRKLYEDAVAERDHAEDEASQNARRRAKEADELKTKARDAERSLKQSQDDLDESRRSEKEWKRRFDALENSTGEAMKDVKDTRSAMGELQTTLDVTDKDRASLKQKLDVSNQRYEQLQKSYKALQMKQSIKPGLVNGARARSPINGTESPNGNQVDLLYLKTILLQFLEVKDKKVRGQLVNPLSQLLQLDKQEQEKWTVAISKG